jgi:hypothetical protein
MRLKLERLRHMMSTKNMILRCGSAEPWNFSSMFNNQSLKKYRAMPTTVKATISKVLLRDDLS